MATITVNPTTELSKIAPFAGQNFKRWKQKISFALQTLKVFYILSDSFTVDPANETEFRDANNCKHYILNTLSNELYDIYVSYESAKDIWTALEKKYVLEDAGSKKHAIANFLHYEMTDDKPVTNQIHDYQNLVHELTIEGIKIVRYSYQEL